jgi:hypothetical protein
MRFWAGGGGEVRYGYVNGHVSSDNLVIVNYFNNFFTNVGEEIANSVPPVNKKPEDLVDYGREIPTMQLGNTTVEHLIKHWL